MEDSKVLASWSVMDIADTAKVILERADALVEKYGPAAHDVLHAAKAFAEAPGFGTASELYAKLMVLAHVYKTPVPVSAINWKDLGQFALTIAQILKLFL